MAAPNPLPKSDYFEKPAIDIADGEVLLFCTLKNEVQRIPYFLDYYREKGIKHFFVIDNASTDGSGEYLQTQEDVHLFHTEMSYKGSSAGRLWMQELAAHYGMDRWCLTVDVDELLVFPGSDLVSIPQLCGYLDHDDSDGLMCVFLDMYSDKPLSQTLYEPGEPFTDVCCWFETDSYILRPGANPPFLSIFGGPRGKSFVQSSENSNGPMMKKVPLVKWHKDFTYIFSTHSHSQLRLSRATGALLHFKFFDFFTELAAREHARGDRRQTKDYAHYAQSMTEGVCFFGGESRRYRSPADLVKLGVLAAPPDLREWFASMAKSEGPAHSTTLKRAFPKVQPNELGGRSTEFSLRDMATIWPFVNNTAAHEYFAAGQTLASAKGANRERYLRQVRNRIDVLDTHEEGVLLYLPEGVLYQVNDPQLTLMCFSGDTFLWQAGLSGEEPRLSVAETALEPMTYALSCDWTPDKNGMLQYLAFYVVANEQIPQGGMAGAAPKTYSDILGKPVRVFPRMSFGDHSVKNGLRRVGMDGVVDRVFEGRINGWLRYNDTQIWNAPVAIYLDGRFVKSVTPKVKRPDLGTEDMDGLEYRTQLPLGYFYEQGHMEVELDVRVAGGNVSLRRAPFKVTGHNSYRWNKQKNAWDGEGAKATFAGSTKSGRLLLRRVGSKLKSLTR